MVVYIWFYHHKCTLYHFRYTKSFSPSFYLFLNLLQYQAPLPLREHATLLLDGMIPSQDVSGSMVDTEIVLTVDVSPSLFLSLYLSLSLFLSPLSSLLLSFAYTLLLAPSSGFLNEMWTYNGYGAWTLVTGTVNCNVRADYTGATPTPGYPSSLLLLPLPLPLPSLPSLPLSLSLSSLPPSPSVSHVYAGGRQGALGWYDNARHQLLLVGGYGIDPNGKMRGEREGGRGEREGREGRDL